MVIYMTTFAQLKSILISKKIKTPEQLNQILKSKHNSIKLFGVSFSPKYKLGQDVFDKATQGKKELSIPEKLFLKFTGKGNPLLNLNIGEGATFKAPKASFGDIATKAKETIIQSVHNLVSSAGKTTIKTVEGDNFAAKEAVQVIETIKGDNVGNGNSRQKIKTVIGHNASQSTAEQSIKLVEGNSDSFGHSNQKLETINGTAREHGNSTRIQIISNELPPSSIPF